MDGTYTKVDPKEGTPVPCRRCPDYAPEGGVRVLLFDKGVFRLHHPARGWRSVGSFTVSGERLFLFNDPNCHLEGGVNTWALSDGKLTLHEVQDGCAIQLRALNLTALPWNSCQPPNVEAAVTGHWPVPPGCEDD